MAVTLIVGDEKVTAGWVSALVACGRHVQSCASALAFQHRFSGEPADVLIIDIVHADHGEAMLIPQVRAHWPGCRIVVTVSDYSFLQSEFYRMGLWSPDEVLLKPVDISAICDRVAHWAWPDDTFQMKLAAGMAGEI